MKNKILSLLKTVNREGMDKLITWLEKSDFFTAPASTKFHGNYEGGLAEHSYNVYQLFKLKVEQFNLGVSEETIIISSILHDLCKVNFYSKAYKNVKEGKKMNYQGREVDNWVEKEIYVIDDKLPLGHGEKSVMLLQSYIKLTREEIFLIRFHMGGFLDGENLKAYYQATDLFPCIVALHTSDYEASTFLEEKREV